MWANEQALASGLSEWVARARGWSGLVGTPRGGWLRAVGRAAGLGPSRAGSGPAVGHHGCRGRGRGCVVGPAGGDRGGRDPALAPLTPTARRRKCSGKGNFTRAFRGVPHPAGLRKPRLTTPRPPPRSGGPCPGVVGAPLPRASGQPRAWGGELQEEESGISWRLEPPSVTTRSPPWLAPLEGPPEAEAGSSLCGQSSLLKFLCLLGALQEAPAPWPLTSSQ